jgi:hypothetical protein
MKSEIMKAIEKACDSITYGEVTIVINASAKTVDIITSERTRLDK